jgi:hypothetical protein
MHPIRPGNGFNHFFKSCHSEARLYRACNPLFAGSEEKQIPPYTSPQFGMTRESAGLVYGNGNC